MEQILSISQTNQQRAWNIIYETKIIDLLQSIGATVNLVGSLKMGLIMKNRDIDFHIYTPYIDIKQDFKIMSCLAANASVKRIEYSNQLDSDDKCISWQAWVEDHVKQMWQIDMIHIVKG